MGSATASTARKSKATIPMSTTARSPSKGAAFAAPKKSKSQACEGMPTHHALPATGGALAPPKKSESAATVWMKPDTALPLKGEASVSPATIETLVALQRQRQFCIVSQGRIDRATESFVARAIGFRSDMKSADRKALYARATAFRRAVEAGGEIPPDLADCVPIVMHSAAARRIWDEHRLNLEKEMQRLALALPAWTWAKDVRGLSAQGVASLIGETGDLANYETKERVWKRLGLAVIDGIAQQRRSNAEQAVAHGFSPKRRAVAWMIGDVLLRAQWRGAREDREAHAIGPYGEVYRCRKEHTVDREGWTPKHRDNDARRVMTKALVEDLWRVWNEKEPLVGKAQPEFAM